MAAWNKQWRSSELRLKVKPRRMCMQITSLRSELFCLVVDLRIDERCTHPGGSPLIRREKSISIKLAAILWISIFLSASSMGDESRGTDSAKSLNTDTLDIKRFSLLGADKRPDNLTLTRDTMRHSKKHGDRSTWRERRVRVCVFISVPVTQLRYWYYTLVRQQLLEGEQHA